MHHADLKSKICVPVISRVIERQAFGTRKRLPFVTTWNSAVNYEAMSLSMIDSQSIDCIGNHTFTDVTVPSIYNAPHIQCLIPTILSLLNDQLNHQHFDSHNWIFTSFRMQRVYINSLH